MALRRVPIVAGEVYHVFNRSVGSQQIFFTDRDYQRCIEVIKFYRFENPSLRFSFYNRLPKDQREQFMSELEETGKHLVEIICFCLMPNHVHFLLKNLKDNGISKFMANLQNSYAKYLNTKTNRTGTLFQQNFKAVRVESDEQLIHVCRYIHLNPVTAYLIKIEDLENYRWSSYPDYIQNSSSFIQKDLVLDQFKSVESFKKFVHDQVDYQRKLGRIKHLTLE